MSRALLVFGLADLAEQVELHVRDAARRPTGADAAAGVALHVLRTLLLPELERVGEPFEARVGVARVGVEPVDDDPHRDTAAVGHDEGAGEVVGAHVPGREPDLLAARGAVDRVQEVTQDPAPRLAVAERVVDPATGRDVVDLRRLLLVLLRLVEPREAGGADRRGSEAVPGRWGRGDSRKGPDEQGRAGCEARQRGHSSHAEVTLLLDLGSWGRLFQEFPRARCWSPGDRG